MLHVHRSERADRLAAALADVLRMPPADPFAVDVVAVPAKGIERWLTQRLSHRLGAAPGDDAGVCANVIFPAPAALVAQSLDAVTGISRDEDPWRPDRCLWPLLEVIDASAAQRWFAPLAHYLGADRPGDEHRRARRVATAASVARLFAEYGSARPGMICTWASGVDDDGRGGALPPDCRWQPELWRRLREHIGVPAPAERLHDACAALRTSPDQVDLPDRLSVFGATRLATDQLAVLAALAIHRDVHLWLPHPSPALWDEVAPLAVAARPVPRKADPTAGVPRHPLLASLGRDARELQWALASCTGETTDTHHSVADPPPTLLGRVQAQLRDDRPAQFPPVPLARDDRSVQVHACHGRARQVEVLREVVLGLLADDLSLEPRDVLVMCPDVETFAPLISATFGLAELAGSDEHPGHRLRVRLADRSLRQTNPLLATLAQLLELAESRVTASQVLDLAATPPVRRRFRFDDDDLERLQDWVPQSGVRWGLDREQRGQFGLRNVGQNTWDAGLARILVGVAMSEEEQRWLGLALPLDDVDSNDIDLAGRLAELVSRLSWTLTALSRRQSLAAALAALVRALELLTEVADADAWQLTEARRELDDVAAAAGERSESATVSLSDLRGLLADRLSGRPTRANFRTGCLTVCSMVPMRSVPHRVVCLLGVDDGVFPRGTGVDGDDILLRDPWVGERDRRSEDRQLFLDALLAAQEFFVVFYSGAHERTNAPQSPAVPVGELLDVLDTTGGRVRDAVVVRHPLQPFDDRNFTPGALGRPGPFSADRSALAGALTARGTRRAEPAFLPAPLPEQPLSELDLDALLRFVEHPVKAFVSRRIGVFVLDEQDEDTDALALELAPLDTWQVGDRMLSARLAGADVDACRQAEWRRGVLPPGPLGSRALDAVAQQVEPLVDAARRCASGAAHALDVAVTLPAGVSVTGTVGGIHGTTLLRVVYSRLAPKHRLRAWVQLLALQAAHPEQLWTAVTIGRATSSALRSTLAGVPTNQAAELLADIVELYQRGQRAPLLLPPATACAYATARAKGSGIDRALQDAAAAWSRSFENSDRHHQYVWRNSSALAPLVADEMPAAPPLTKETTPFGELACRLWLPLLAAETLAEP